MLSVEHLTITTQERHNISQRSKKKIIMSIGHYVELLEATEQPIFNAVVR